MIEQKPKISVIIPIYNTGDYLEETLVSLLNQTMIEDIEVLMIDDGSTDDSRYIIEKYALDYDNFYAFHKENGGQGVARNYGFDLAKGEFIHFLDSDDYITPEAYEKLYNVAISNNYDFVAANVYRFNNYNCREDMLFKNSFKGLNGTTEFKSINEHPALVWDTSASNKLYKKSFLEKNNIRFPNKKLFYEDILFSTETYLKSEFFCFFDEYIYYWRYRHNHSSVTQNVMSIKNFKDRLEIIRLIKKLSEKSDLTVQTLNKLYEKWLFHDIKMFVKYINGYEPQYYVELLDEILDIIKDIPHDIIDGLKSYHKIIYKMIEDKDIDGLLYFAPLDDTLKKNPNYKLDLNEDYLKLIDFKKDSSDEEFIPYVENIENDENNFFIEFEWNIAYLDNGYSANIESVLIDENNQEYPLDIIDKKIILPLKLIVNKEFVKIQMFWSMDSIKKESFLKNYGRSNIKINNMNFEIGIGKNSILNINSRELNQNEIKIEDIAFDGQHLIFKGVSEQKMDNLMIENVIDFTKFSYPIDFNQNNFSFRIPYADIINSPIKKWELKCNYILRLRKSYTFFRNSDKIFIIDTRDIILIEDDIYNKFDELHDILEEFKQTRYELSIENSKLSKRNRKLEEKNQILKDKNNELKDKNKDLKNKNKDLKDKNQKLKQTIDEFKSRKIIRYTDKIKKV